MFPSGACVCAKSLQSSPTLCDLMDGSPPGSSVHGILQAQILEWIAMPSSRGSSQPRDQTSISYVSCTGRWVLYHLHHLGSPFPNGPHPNLKAVPVLQNVKHWLVISIILARV